MSIPHGVRADDAGEDVSPVEQFLDNTSQFVAEQAKKIVAERYFYPRIELSPYATLQMTTNSYGKVNYGYDIRNLTHQDDLAIVQFSIAIDFLAVRCGIFSSEAACEKLRGSPFGLRRGLHFTVEGSLYRLAAAGENHAASPDFAYVGNLLAVAYYTFSEESPHPELRIGVGNTRIDTGNPAIGYDGLSYMAALLMGEDFKKGPGFVQGKISYVWGEQNSDSNSLARANTPRFEALTISIVFTFRG